MSGTSQHLRKPVLLRSHCHRRSRRSKRDGSAGRWLRGKAVRAPSSTVDTHLMIGGRRAEGDRNLHLEGACSASPDPLSTRGVRGSFFFRPPPLRPRGTAAAASRSPSSVPQCGGTSPFEPAAAIGASSRAPVICWAFAAEARLLGGSDGTLQHHVPGVRGRRRRGAHLHRPREPEGVRRRSRARRARTRFPFRATISGDGTLRGQPSDLQGHRHARERRRAMAGLEVGRGDRGHLLRASRSPPQCIRAGGADPRRPP